MSGKTGFVRLGFVVALLAVAGCGGKINGFAQRQTQTFDGQTFRGTAKGDSEDRQRFVATVREPSKSIDGALDAAAYQGTRYCIETYGTSDIDWEVGPDTPADKVVVRDGTLSLVGRCRDL